MRRNFPVHQHFDTDSKSKVIIAFSSDMKNIFTKCQSELQITVTYNLRGQDNPPTVTTHSDA